MLKDIYEIRRDWLNIAYKELNLNKKEFAEKLGVTPSKASRFLNGNVNIGSAVARKIEIALGWQKNQMDQQCVTESFDVFLSKIATERGYKLQPLEHA